MTKTVAEDAEGCRSPGCGKDIRARGVCAACYYYLRAEERPRCQVDGCDRIQKASGYCSMHYSRNARHGDPLDSGARVVEFPQGNSGLNCRVDGCEKPAKTRGYCSAHHHRLLRFGDPTGSAEWEPKGWLTADGYRMIHVPSNYPGARNTGGSRPGGGSWVILEHRYVMQEMLGRSLYPGETVHHKNGVRSDNSPDNLELWIKSQPAGQRVADHLEWARKIITRYGDLVERAAITPGTPEKTQPDRRGGIIALPVLAKKGRRRREVIVAGEGSAKTDSAA